MLRLIVNIRGLQATLSDIFISYSKLDRAKAQMLAEALKREGWSIWWDPKIPPGRTFDEVIEQALAGAKCAIVLWSKNSVTSRWVKAEASEANRRGVLVPALIEDDVKIPLEFRYQHASRLTDWEGQAGHLEFDELKDAVAGLLVQEDTITEKTETARGPKQTETRGELPDDIYLDPGTSLMWTISDNGQDVNWHEANEHARQFRLGGYSDWRLPTIEELGRLYDEKVAEINIRKPFKLTSEVVWSSTQEDSDTACYFNFDGGRRYRYRLDGPGRIRVLCVRETGE